MKKETIISGIAVALICCVAIAGTAWYYGSKPKTTTVNISDAYEQFVEVSEEREVDDVWIMDRTFDADSNGDIADCMVRYSDGDVSFAEFDINDISSWYLANE